MEISMERILHLRQMQNTSYARAQVKKDVCYLDSISFIYHNSKKGRVLARVGAENAHFHKGILYFQFDETMRPLLPARQYMPLPDTILHTVKNENILARLLLTWRICQHKRMNLDKANADLVPIRSLLTCCTAIPSYKELKHRQVNQKIIEPFEKALDKCAPYFTWAYENTMPETYDDFIHAHICINWKTAPYPNNCDFIKAKAKRRSGKSK